VGVPSGRSERGLASRGRGLSDLQAAAGVNGRLATRTLTDRRVRARVGRQQAGPRRAASGSSAGTLVLDRRRHGQVADQLG